MGFEEKRQKKRERSKKYYYAHPEKRPSKEEIRARAAKHRANTNNTIKERYFLKKYGLTKAEVDAMAIAQNGLCAICLCQSDKTLNVDHCHATRRVRGLLCGNCNRAIGLLRHDIEILQRAIKYLIPK